MHIAGRQMNSPAFPARLDVGDQSLCHAAAGGTTSVVGRGSRSIESVIASDGDWEYACVPDDDGACRRTARRPSAKVSAIRCGEEGGLRVG